MEFLNGRIYLISTPARISVNATSLTSSIGTLSPKKIALVPTSGIPGSPSVNLKSNSRRADFIIPQSTSFGKYSTVICCRNSELVERSILVRAIFAGV